MLTLIMLNDKDEEPINKELLEKIQKNFRNISEGQCSVFVDQYVIFLPTTPAYNRPL